MSMLYAGSVRVTFKFKLVLFREYAFS